MKMDFGKVKYHIAVRTKTKIKAEGKVKDFTAKSLRLTLIGRNDEYILSSGGLSELRKKRIMRLTREAHKQGVPLGYEDLNALLLSSVSTLKRDINILEKQGYVIPLKGRRKVSIG